MRIGEQGTDGTAPRHFGVYPAIVTDIVDPDSLGRIQLKFPWLGEAGADVRAAGPGELADVPCPFSRVIDTSENPASAQTSDRVADRPTFMQSPGIRPVARYPVPPGCQPRS